MTSEKSVNDSAAIDADPACQLAAAKSPRTTAAVLDLLANSPRELVLIAVAENPSTSEAARYSAFQSLVKRDIFTRRIASNCLTSAPLLDGLTGHSLDEVRIDVAENPSASGVALTLLASDKVRFVRSAVASNRSTPVQVLEILAKDSDVLVAGSVATNTATPLEVLQLLARSTDPRLRFGITINSATPKNILESLAKDDSRQVREQVKMMLKHLAFQAARTKAPPTKKPKMASTAAAPKLDEPRQLGKEKSKKLRMPSEKSVLTVKRTLKHQKQIARATELKNLIIEDIKRCFPDVLKPEMADSDERLLLRHIELSAESFDVTFHACSPVLVDRTASMLSGPFFTSKKHPIPEADSEMLYPIVQLDLRTASSLACELLGDGLLQLWYDVNTNKGVVRVVPRADVTTTGATEFRFVPARKFDGFLLPGDWDSDPIGDMVQVISKFNSIGIASQTDYGSGYLDGISERFEVPNELQAMVVEFERMTDVTSTSEVHLLGSFYPIQYSSADVGKRCLFATGGDWGSSGGAQVFYEVEKNGNVSFEFWDCLR
jgi:hypothetical protein